MLSQYLLTEWVPLNISQPTWKREGSCSYWTEEKTEAQRGRAVLPGSRPHSSHTARLVAGKQRDLRGHETLSSSTVVVRP